MLRILSLQAGHMADVLRIQDECCTARQPDRRPASKLASYGAGALLMTARL